MSETESVCESREPAPDWIPYTTDEKPSDAMPQAGFEDWRAQAEWWQANAVYWREQWERVRGV
jgi:hypothetical protein